LDRLNCRGWALALSIVLILMGTISNSGQQRCGQRYPRESGAGPGGISVFAPDATHLGDIETGRPTSNVAWGEDGGTLFVTGGNSVYRIRLVTKGARY
jgi:hypothetical protein